MPAGRQWVHLLEATLAYRALFLRSVLLITKGT